MSAPRKIVELRATKPHCNDCRMQSRCLTPGLQQSELERLAQLPLNSKVLGHGQPLYRMGDPVTALYTLRSGALKSITLTEDGREQILAFHCPGDIIGLDGIGQDRHPNGVYALERASLCVIPHRELERLTEEIPALGRRLLQIMGEELQQETRQMTLLARRSAEERFAAFLVGQSRCLRERGFRYEEFRLTMPRIDISNYLGLTAETLSRLINRFQRLGLIVMRRRQVLIRDRERLHTLAGLEPLHRPEPLRGGGRS